MAYFITIDGLNGPKAVSRTLYRTKAEARAELLSRTIRAHPCVAEKLRIMDADHEPGRSIMLARHVPVTR